MSDWKKEKFKEAAKSTIKERKKQLLNPQTDEFKKKYESLIVHMANIVS